MDLGKPRIVQGETELNILRFQFDRINSSPVVSGLTPFSFFKVFCNSVCVLGVCKCNSLYNLHIFLWNSITCDNIK